MKRIMIIIINNKRNIDIKERYRIFLPNLNRYLGHVKNKLINNYIFKCNVMNCLFMLEE